MPLEETLIVAVILLGVFIIVYSKIRDQGMKDTVDEMIEIVKPIKELGK